MAKQETKEHVPPERVLAENIELMRGEMDGKDRITRYGERYFMSCRCGNFKTTVDVVDVTKFIAEHMENCTEDERLLT